MLEVSELTKLYREGRGVRNLTFQVDSGKAFGFLGPNGAGKTTTIRLLMGFMKPNHGSATINGLDCWQNRSELKKIIGYLPGELHFLDYLTGQEFLDLMEGMYGEYQEFQVKRRQLLNYLELNEKQRIRKMSKGMKQKLGIIAALMLGSQVLVLDEPTSGLDPLMQKTFVELIQEEKRKGKTIFMSSHQFSEVEKICDQVGIISEGELLTVQEINSLKEYERQRFEIEVEGIEDAEFLCKSGLKLHSLGGLRFITLVTKEQKLLWETLAQIQVKRFKQVYLELEDAFLQYYSSSKGGIGFEFGTFSDDDEAERPKDC